MALQVSPTQSHIWGKFRRRSIHSCCTSTPGCSCQSVSAKLLVSDACVNRNCDRTGPANNTAKSLLWPLLVIVGLPFRFCPRPGLRCFCLKSTASTTSKHCRPEPSRVNLQARHPNPWPLYNLRALSPAILDLAPPKFSTKSSPAPRNLVLRTDARFRFLPKLLTQ